MDAKRQSKYPCSPRGNRAVDVQALWYTQLTNASDLARYMNREEDARRWNLAAERLRSNFEQDFVDTVAQSIYDHLNTDGSGDAQFRPNAIYALELVSDPDLKMQRQKKFGNVWYIRGECPHSISPMNSSILIMSNGIVIIKMMLIIMARYGFGIMVWPCSG